MSHALWHLDATQSALRDATPDGAVSNVAVKARYSMISTGTERLVACGKVPATAHDAMSAPYMAGSFGFPIKYGYSLVGHDPEGQAVHCLHPHQSTAWVAAGDLVALPDGVPLDRMALASNLETALNAVWDAPPHTGEAVVVCGFGSVGALLALTLRLVHKSDVVVVERDHYRAALASELGFEVQRDDVPRTADFKLLFHTTGTASGLQWCLDHAAFEARVVELSWHGDASVALALGDRFHYNRLRILSSQVGHVAHPQRETLSHRDRRAAAIDLLTDPVFDSIPRTHVPFEEAPQFFETLRAGAMPDGLVWIIDYGG